MTKVLIIIESVPKSNKLQRMPCQPYVKIQSILMIQDDAYNLLLGLKNCYLLKICNSYPIKLIDIANNKFLACKLFFLSL